MWEFSSVLPARHFWDAAYLEKFAPSLFVVDDRSDAPKDYYFSAGDQHQVGQFLHGYKSAWLPVALLREDRQSSLVDACFAATRHWEFALHFNKGLAGAPASELAAAKNIATNADVLDAFALAIMGAEGPPAYPGMPGSNPDLAAARNDAANIGKAMDTLLRVAPGAGSYVSESDYFQRGWQKAVCRLEPWLLRRPVNRCQSRLSTDLG